YENKRVGDPFLDITVPKESILKVTLSPWLNKRLTKTIKQIIHAVPGWQDLKVVRSTLIGNSEWKRLADNAI
ncbi:MAG: hypothetical protein ACRD3W_06770, partial [Terriglobales bacterium]